MSCVIRPGLSFLESGLKVDALRAELNRLVKQEILRQQAQTDIDGGKLPTCHFAALLGISPAMLSYVMTKEKPMSIELALRCLAVLGYTTELKTAR
jgi:hypothetical protein